jgi:hypothetical protein
MAGSGNISAFRWIGVGLMSGMSLGRWDVRIIGLGINCGILKKLSNFFYFCKEI